ncbi:hypothetical protein POM88_049735 [Heracleum sosnowskyi]|uniref:TF-B3 domain-containing protein n=1 Tax=Heracleum sosnowskyi TaxID=360622 RepID=A0AAD8M1N8_9APIA|nr:hypothetical protein POM88_049735 [Heracleum sosnowskyi]
MGSREACDECKLNCSLMHRRKKDPSPLITTFHKILFGVYEYSKYLCLPQKISQTIPVLVAGQDHFLEDTNGQQWQVTLGTKDGHLAFVKGWDKFFADHSLREGYILAFHYIMGSHFVVQIIDNTGFEKFRFPVASGRKRKRRKIDENGNAVGECQNLSNSVFSGGISDSEARIHSQPMSKDKPSSLESENGIYQHVASADNDVEKLFLINRDAGYKYEEERSPLLGFIKFEMQLKVDPGGSKDKRTSPNTSAECNAVGGNLYENQVSAMVVMGEPPSKVAAPTFSNNNNVHLKRENAEGCNAVAGNIDENPVSAKVASGEPPAKVAAPTSSNNNNVHLKRESAEECNAVAGNLDKNLVAAKVVSGVPPAKVAVPTFSNKNNIHLKRENVEVVVNDHRGDNPSVLPIENRAGSSTTSSKRVKIEEAAGSKNHSSEIVKLPKAEVMEFGKSPSHEFMSSEKYPKFKDKSNQIFGGDEKHNEVRKVVKSEPMDSLNDERLDASALSFSVMVGSSEHLELPTSVTLWASTEKKVVNLKGPDKRVWPVLFYRKFGIKAFTSGWKNVFMSYRLRIGDECAVVLENEAETIFRIDVNNK